jgi:signal transduction histidine kinase
MTPGTSPHPRGTPSMRWTVAEHIRSAHARLAVWMTWLPNGTVAGPPIARLASVLYLAALAVLAMTAWHDPSPTASGLMGGLPAWHLAFLMVTGTGMALLTLTSPQVAASEARESEPMSTRPTGLSELMAQMSHELRTPLNAVIGFSELMLHELHGPLGNARYQEYAHHISESGGRLLKSSEDALAVTEAMTALMTDRGSAKRERRVAATLVREAWRAATSASESAAPRLVLNTCTTCDLTCEQRPTAQAFEHLLGEAMVRAGAGSAVTVTGRRQARNRSVEIRVERGPAGLQQREDNSAHAGLRIILARLLLEMQGASVLCSATSEAWVARIDFPGRA